MSKVGLSFGSFVLGVATFFVGSHISTVVHPSLLAFAQAVSIGNAEPTVPALSNNEFSGATLSSPTQPLDGLNCTKCVISAAVLTYAGGQFKCAECSLKTQRLELKGAALNTLNLLKIVGAFGAPRPQSPAIDQDAPRIMIASDKAKTPITLTSLEK